MFREAKDQSGQDRVASSEGKAVGIFLFCGYDRSSAGPVGEKLPQGIEKQNIPRLFERFYRVDKSGARSEGGSGLGLAIVKHIIEGHDEKIYVESQIGVGSEFSFTLEKSK